MQENKALWNKNKSAMKCESALKAWKRFESLKALLKMHKCPFFLKNSAYWTIIKRYAYCLEKIPTLDDSANILELLYTS